MGRRKRGLQKWEGKNFEGNNYCINNHSNTCCGLDIKVKLSWQEN